MVMNLEKRITEMSSEGPKWWKGGMGWPEMAEKHKILVTKLAAAAAFASLIRAHSAAVGRKILPAWSSGPPPPPYMARLQ